MLVMMYNRFSAFVRYSWPERKVVAVLEIVWKYFIIVNHVTQQSHSWSIYFRVRKT